MPKKLEDDSDSSEKAIELGAIELKEDSGLQITDIKKIIESGIIEVLGSDDSVILIEKGDLIFKDKIVTAKNGFGFNEGSGKTPTGLFKISEVIGNGKDKYALFKGRKFVENIDGPSPDGEVVADRIISRIFVLDGLEESNKNTKSRYIYFHGNAHEWYWDTEDLKRSHGCIGLKPEKMIELTNLVLKRKIQNKETYVYIKEK